MNKETCCKEISRFIEQCRELRMADCENDFAKQIELRNRIKRFLKENVVDAVSWANAVEGISFDSCTGPAGGFYDKRAAQTAFDDGVDRLGGILTQLMSTVDSCSERDVRLVVPFERVNE